MSKSKLHPTILKEFVGLHETIEICYSVTHYTARLYTMDGGKLLLRADGEDPIDALTNLDRLVEQATYEQLYPFG